MTTAKRVVHPGVSPNLALAVRITEFWMLVNRVSDDECWEWKGYRDEHGYGMFQFGGRMRFAHDLAVSFRTGEERDPALETCHSCHNPPCCNPSHLRYDTHKANVADMVAAGRHRRGATKLNAEVAEVIRQRIAAGARQQDLADQYGVNNSMISMIKTGRRYAK